MTTFSEDCALPLAREGRAHQRSMGFTPTPPAKAAALLTDATEGHLLAVARTGAGKGRSLLLPWLLSYPGSAVVIDPKGEAASVTARYRREVGQRVCIVDPWNVVRLPADHETGCDSLNPLEVMLKDSHDLGDDCMALAYLIAGQAPVSLQDPFWRECALHLLTGLIGWVWVRAEVTKTAQPDDGTLAGVWRLLHHDDLVYHLAQTLDLHGKNPAMPAFVHEAMVNFIQHEAEKVRTSVRSEAVSLMRVFSSQRVQRATAQSTVPLPTLRDGGAVTVYLVVPPDRLESHAAYLRILLGSLLGVMVRRRARPPRPTLFLVDELGHLGPVPQLKQAITLMRGYGVRVALFLQSMAQLKELWPRDHEAILENCGVWLNFGNASLAAARKMADQLGDVSAETLFQLADDELALHRAGQPTVLARKLDYLHDPLFKWRYDANPLHANEPAHGSGRRAQER